MLSSGASHRDEFLAQTKAAREERMMAAARSEAATRIQSRVRGWLARLRVRLLVREECDAMFTALEEGAPFVVDLVSNIGWQCHTVTQGHRDTGTGVTDK